MVVADVNDRAVVLVARCLLTRTIILDGSQYFPVIPFKTNNSVLYTAVLIQGVGDDSHSGQEFLQYIRVRGKRTNLKCVQCVIRTRM